MSSRAKAIVLLLALAGLGLAVASTWVHYRILTDPSYVSPCNINAQFSCTQVYLSPYGSVAGVPVALGGLLWFSLVLLTAGFARPVEKDSVAAGYLFALATIGLAVIVYLGYASIFILKTGCIYCIGTYICVLGIFITTSLMKPVSMSSLPGRLLRDVTAAIRQPATLVAALVLLGGTASLMAFFPREGAPSETQAISSDAEQNFQTAWFQQPRADLGIPADGAKVVIVKFNDFMCGACKQAEVFYKPVLEKLEKEHPGQVKYVLKDWPWNSACNFNARSTIPGHEAACDAAAASRMAADRGKVKEMNEWLYGNQNTAPQAVRDAASRILGVTDFDKEYAAKLADIRRDIADGGVLQIDSTPTFFINGVRLPGTIRPEYFELAINLELKKAAAQ